MTAADGLVFRDAEASAAALAVDDGALPRLVEAMQRCVPRAAIGMVLFGSGGDGEGAAPTPVRAALAGFGGRDLDAYFRYFHALNPFDRGFARAPHGRAITAGELALPSLYRESEFYRDWARHTETLETGVGVPFFSKGRLTAALSINFGPGFDERHSQALKPALNRLAAVIDASLSNRKAMLQMQNRTTHLVDGLGAPALILSATGGLLSANAAAEALLKAGSLMSLREGALQLADAAAHAALTKQLLAWRGGGVLEASPLVLPRPDMSPAILRLLPFVGIGAESGALASTLQVMAVLIDPDIAPKPAAKLLSKVYGLTAAESAVALAIADGATLEDYAQARGISALTARNHLRNASDKMGARRQSQVVSRVLRLGLAGDGM